VIGDLVISWKQPRPARGKKAGPLHSRQLSIVRILKRPLRFWNIQARDSIFQLADRRQFRFQLRRQQAVLGDAHLAFHITQGVLHDGLVFSATKNIRLALENHVGDRRRADRSLSRPNLAALDWRECRRRFPNSEELAQRSQRGQL
jgi:hypothetical protein